MTVKEKKTLLTGDYNDYTYDMFMFNFTRETDEIDEFSEWLETLREKEVYSFESTRMGAQKPTVDLIREDKKHYSLLNYCSYNYLGFGYEKAVLDAASNALYKYGLGAASSPVVGGTYKIHKQLESALVNFFGMEGKGVSLFSSGYGVNLGTIQAFMKPGGVILLDKSVHISIVEGAHLSGAKTDYFNHNDMEDLERLLELHSDEGTRILVCLEGVYSADGDYGNIADTVKLAKKYSAYTLVDEAHSVLVAGEHGRGVAEMQNVLEDIDLYVMTFSKGFGGVGGAVLANKNIVQYINWYARCRMFSCALDPAVTGGLVKVLELAAGEEGKIRRKRIKENANYFRNLLKEKVSIGLSESWIVPIMYGNDHNTLSLGDFLQSNGLDSSIMQFPAVPKNEGRIRMFITSEHSKEQLEQAANIILKAAEKFDFGSTQMK